MPSAAVHRHGPAGRSAENYLAENADKGIDFRPPDRILYSCTYIRRSLVAWRRTWHPQIAGVTPLPLVDACACVLPAVRTKEPDEPKWNVSKITFTPRGVDEPVLQEVERLRKRIFPARLPQMHASFIENKMKRHETKR
jgi:hypothetical protein